ncbi:hypothetical protein GCM10007276_32970 [Agaricicola taiwanensis]|uniref:DUF1850 domain-containing protein n=1 Tax=Agaricicola taiwanensis TaxID=591372 RepID=A0A8J2YMJ6_9RHOB|nr:DUF1850 domain-containing protein [Agaricicola taiwanensis]GGE53339.1 hypothetical protein GCM10007276_32970 [Agaricicola taiwanensis]
MSLLCLAGGGTVTKLAVAAFTLTWMHTIEKIPWEEDWHLSGKELVVDEVRIKGTGAGMEPAPDARLEDGFYRWTPKDNTRTEIILRRSDAPNVGDWNFCTEGQCRTLGTIVPETADPVRLYPCD